MVLPSGYLFKSVTDFLCLQPGKKGTAILRRNVKQTDMKTLSLCFSLIMPTRTFDIQCVSVEDFDVLYNNLCAFLLSMKAT
jgi:hypothetical protein